MPLTDRECKNAKPEVKTYRLTDANGLYLEVAPIGGRYWRFKYKFLGKEKRLAFGVYPEVSLAEAREKRDQAKKRLAEGIDPSEYKKGVKREAILNAAITFELVMREWHENQKGAWSEGHAKDVLHRMEMDVFSEILL